MSKRVGTVGDFHRRPFFPGYQCPIVKKEFLVALDFSVALENVFNTRKRARCLFIRGTSESTTCSPVDRVTALSNPAHFTRTKVTINLYEHA
jgi:hypothetical protein